MEYVLVYQKVGDPNRIGTLIYIAQDKLTQYWGPVLIFQFIFSERLNKMMNFSVCYTFQMGLVFEI